MTLLEIQLLWGSSTCGRSIEQFTFDTLNEELATLKKVYNDLAESHAKQLIDIGELNKEKDALELAWFNKNIEVESELLKANEIINHLKSELINKSQELSLMREDSNS